MREYKFRGQDVNGKFVFGNLHVDKNAHDTSKNLYYIIRQGFVPTLTMPAANYIEVKPETVGQYTGLIDEKGIEVFENDIIECYGEDNEVILVAEVQFQEGGFCVQIDYDLHLIPLDAFGSAYKVIGNIHEHPHLATK